MDRRLLIGTMLSVALLSSVRGQSTADIVDEVRTRHRAGIDSIRTLSCKITVKEEYICPTDGRLSTALTTPTGDVAAFGSYVGVGGTYWIGDFRPGMFSRDPGVRLTDAADGTAQTLMLGERPPPDSLQAGRWYSGFEILEPFGGPDTILCVNQIRISPFDTECNQASTDFGPGSTDNPCD